MEQGCQLERRECTLELRTGSGGSGGCCAAGEAVEGVGAVSLSQAVGGPGAQQPAVSWWTPRRYCSSDHLLLSSQCGLLSCPHPQLLCLML